MSLSNKELVLSFYKKVIGGRNPALINDYIHEQYIQHSPFVADGREGLRAAIEQLQQLPAAEPVPDAVKVCITDGEFVAVYLEVDLMGRQLKVADIFRLRHNKIIEHWDAMQDRADGVEHESVRKNMQMFLVLKEDAFKCRQSTGTKNNMPYVYYDFFEGYELKWSVEQAVPSNPVHSNPMV